MTLLRQHINEGAMEPSPCVAALHCWGRGRAPHMARLRASLCPRFIGTETIMSNAKRIYDIADNHAHTVQVCIDRLHELGANEQLKLLTARLQKLVVRAIAGDDDQGTKAAQRQARRPQNSKGQPSKRAS
jgi:hypothetical protein